MGSHAELVRVLAEQFARADVSLRELESRADRAGGARLPRATCADMLAGRRFPKKAVMLAFLRACRVPEQQIPAWERAWERVRITRMAIGEDREPPGGAPLADQGTAEAVTVRGSGGSRQRAVLLAALVAVVVSGAVIALSVRSRHGVPEDLPVRTMDPGHLVTDDGRAFPRGGWSRFTVTVDPDHTAVRLIRRLDVGVALQHATITVNGRPAAEWRPLLSESTYKWRDQVVELPPELTTGRSSLTIVNTSVSSSGFNEFYYTVEQQVDGVWSISDEVDIGREHPAGEAEHAYRNVGEDWADTQTFAYPPRKEDWRVR
ncbi:hypothetical protein [Nonomuraea harbinensis]|uniref:XRE family transcriptional regulator n=1 Tax=Nonomuraea harbinensis TaxID=1286938 RepID=A0ABW1CA16_9ACTN|nr:hypothetical protein [Nonomuraea harbinensis]